MEDCVLGSPRDPTTDGTIDSLKRRRHNSYDKSFVHQSACLAKNKVLKDLGIVSDDGKLNEDAIQEYAECVKELLSPDLLKLLMLTDGRAFWDLVAGMSLPLCKTSLLLKCLLLFLLVFFVVDEIFLLV